MSIESTVPPTPPARLEPGVGSSYRNGWQHLWKNFLELFLIGLITVLLQAPEQWFNRQREPSAGLGLLGLLYSILVSGPLSYGASYAYLRAARGEKPDMGDVFAGFKNYKNAVLANLLVIGIVIVAFLPLIIPFGILAFTSGGFRTFPDFAFPSTRFWAFLAGFLVLMIPGMIVSLKLSFVPYLVIDRKMTPVQAAKESWRMTGGHTWQIFLVGLSAIPIVIGGLLVMVVGIIPALMWVALAGASLYHAVSQTRSTTQSATSATPSPPPATP